MLRRGGDDRVALITGASAGIGLALAHAMSEAGFRLVLTAREASLARLGEQGFIDGKRTMLAPLDVTRAEQADRLLEAVAARWGGVDVLINNAGVCYRAVIEHLTDEDELDQICVNYLGPLHLIRGVLPYMRSRRRGHIVNLSSVGGMMAMPTMGGYSASKFALEGASEALWYELKPWGIHVTLVEPGFVHSNSFKKAVWTSQSKASSQSQTDAYHAYYQNLVPFIGRMMGRSPTTPQKIAIKIVHTLQRNHPPLRLPVTIDAHLFALLRRLLPARLYHQVLYMGLPHIREWVTKDES